MSRGSPIYNFAADLRSRCMAEYALYVLDYQERAEAACRGLLVNSRGRTLGVQGHELLSGPSHHSKSAAYASEELHEFILANPLLSAERYERQWLEAEVGQVIA